VANLEFERKNGFWFIYFRFYSFTSLLVFLSYRFGLKLHFVQFSIFSLRKEKILLEKDERNINLLVDHTSIIIKKVINEFYLTR
jgi:hypothetical protein